MQADWSMVYVTEGLLAVAVAQAGLFLWQLWLLRRTAADTAKSANAAEKAANAALGVELPRLELTGVRWATAIMTGHSTTVRINAAVSFRNRGRTDAMLVESCAVIILGKLPSSPVYPRAATTMADIGEVVEPGEAFAVPFPMGRNPPPGSAQAIGAGDEVWVIGYSIYRDFLGGHWRSRFCLTPEQRPKHLPTLIESYAYPHYTGREPFDPSKPRADLVDDMPGLIKATDSATGLTQFPTYEPNS